MTSQYCIHIEITIDQPDFFEDLPDSCYSHYFMIGELLEENVSLFIDACLCNSEIMSGLYQEVGLINISFYFEVFELVCFNDVPIPAKYNLSYIKTPELKQAIEELRLRYCALDNKKTIPIDDDSPAVLPDSIVDDKDKQDKVQDYCLKLELYDGGFPSDVAIRYIGKLYQSQIESFRKRCLIELKGLLQSEMIRCYYNGLLLETPSSPKLFLSMLPFKELTSEQEAVLDCSFGDDVIDKLESIRKECFNSVQFTSAVVAPAVSDSSAVPASAPADNDLSDNKIVNRKTTQKKKGGRPSKETVDKICYAIIKMFVSYQSSKSINDIKELEDAVKKINRRLQDLKCNDVEISVRQLDVDKIPGRLFRCLWKIKTGRFEWGYNEDKFQRDRELIDKYRKKHKEFEEWLEITLNNRL